MTDDLTYKLEFQAALNAGNTVSQLAALQERVDSLIQANQISLETWDQIDGALEAATARLRDYSTVIPTLVADQKLLTEWSKNNAAAQKEEAAALKAKTDAQQASAAMVKKIGAETAAALKEEENAALAAAAAQQKLNEQALGAGTTASRTNFNAIQAGSSAVHNAAAKLPAYSTSSTDSAATVKYNEEIYALQKQLASAQQEFNSRIRATTSAFQEQVAVLQAEKGVLSATQLAALQEKMRQNTVGATTALKEEVAQIQAAGRALAENNAVQQRGLNGMGTTSRGGGGASFAALFLQEQAYQRTAKALDGLAIASVKTSAEYEAAFANVARTTDVAGKSAAGNIEFIRQGLMKLDTEIPMSFQDLAKIATMGNEIGVSAGGLLNFTKTVAQYSTITGTSAETTANALGSLNEILHLNNQEYTQLGSAISYVGRMSVASEPEIVSMLQKISSTASQAGMSKQEIVGLAGAFASLKEAPERAQSALQSYTKVLDKALAQGADSKAVKNWASVLGITPEEVEKEATTNATKFMERFLSVLNSNSQVGKTQIFGDLGLNNARVTEAFSRLSSSIPLLKKLIDDSNKSWAKGTDLQTQYNKATDTLAAKTAELKDAFANLLADIGDSGLSKEFKAIASALLAVVKGIDGFVKKNPEVARLAVTFAALFGAFLLVRSAMLGVEIVAKAFTFFGATNTAGVGGFARALKDLGVQMGIVKLQSAGVVGALEETGAASIVAGEEVAAGAKVAGSGIAVGETLASAGLSALFMILGLVVTWLITDWPGAMRFAAGALGWFGDALSQFTPLVAGFDMDLGVAVESALRTAQVLTQIASQMLSVFGLFKTSTSDLIGGWSSSLGKTADMFGNLSKSAVANVDIAGRQAKAFKDASKSLNDYANSMDGADKATTAIDPGLKAAQDALKKAEKAAEGAGAGGDKAAKGLGNAGNAADKAAKQVRTFADYASDLSGVLTRSFDIEFGPTQANDSIISTFDQMKQNAAQAKQAVDQTRDSITKLRAEIGAARADNQKQNYFLGIANQFGDKLRSGQIQSQIDTNNATISGDQTQLSGAQSQLATDIDKATTSLVGNTAGAAANREALIGLAQKYQDYIAKLAASGASQKALEKATRDGKAEFIRQATQLGFNRTEVGKVSDSFNHMITVIKGVPRNVTVNVNKDPAIMALSEFAAKAKSTAASVKSSLGGLRGISLPSITTPLSPSKGDRENALKIMLKDAEMRWNTQTRGGSINSNAAIADLNRIVQYKNQLASGNYYDGGYTGAGGKYEPAGVVHRGEYVIPKQYVNQSTGLPYADALGRLVAGIQPPKNGYSSGGYVNPGMQFVELGPRSLAAVRDVARQEAVAVISAGTLTGAVNSTNRVNRRRGGG